MGFANLLTIARTSAVLQSRTKDTDRYPEHDDAPVRQDFASTIYEISSGFLGAGRPLFLDFHLYITLVNRGAHGNLLGTYCTFLDSSGPQSGHTWIKIEHPRLGAYRTSSFQNNVLKISIQICLYCHSCDQD